MIQDLVYKFEQCETSYKKIFLVTKRSISSRVREENYEY